MNYENVTAELAYDLIAHGAWTVHEFQAWYIAKLQKADETKKYMPDFKQIQKGSRLKIHLSDVVHDSERRGFI